MTYNWQKHLFSVKFEETFNTPINKKVILSVVFVIGMIVTSFGQTIDGKPFENIDAEYMQIYGRARELAPNKLAITLDFGGKNKIWSSKDDPIIKNKDGIIIKFISMIDALNFMHSIGYEFVNSYTLSLGDQNMYHYLLRKVKE